jgi:hypothetical protein
MREACSVSTQKTIVFWNRDCEPPGAIGTCSPFRAGLGLIGVAGGARVKGSVGSSPGLV